MENCLALACVKKYMVEENRFKEKWTKKIRQVSNFSVVKCKTKKWLSPKGNGFSSRARTRYCIQSFWSQTVPVGGWWRSPLCIIQLSNTNTPHCEVFGTILFFFFNRCMIPGWFTPLFLRPSSAILHPPLPVFAFLVQFPFLSPGVLTAAWMNIGVYVWVQTTVSFSF